jgi:hypothetical protein
LDKEKELKDNINNKRKIIQDKMKKW